MAKRSTYLYRVGIAFSDAFGNLVGQYPGIPTRCTMQIAVFGIGAVISYLNEYSAKQVRLSLAALVQTLFSLVPDRTPERAWLP
jgi:hypothetical protein